jgi:hypothetical protein
MQNTSATPLILAARRLREAEAEVDSLRARLAQTAGEGADRHHALRNLNACERSLYNRRLEFEALQRQRRRTSEPRPH